LPKAAIDGSKSFALQPQGVISANIGCTTHLQSGSGLPVRHWVELVDGALQSTVII